MQLHHTTVVKPCLLVLSLVALAAGSFSVSAQQNLETPAAETQAVQAQPAPQAAANFDLLELRVKGNTLLDKKQLERTVYPFLGPKKSIDNVEMARTALEDLYRTNGYQTVAVDIPEQDVKNGIVYLQVVEGKVSKLRVKDSRYFSLGKIKAGVPELAEGNVPNLPKMQQQLAELSGQSADRQIQPILRAGETPGTLEVDLKVKDELPLHGRIELNGRNTSTTSRLRLVSSLRYDNLWQEMHSASLMYQVSPENNEEVDVWAGTYALPLFDSPTRLAFYAVSSSSSAQIASAGALSVIGIGNIYGARLVRPFKSLNDYSHNGTLGVDYKDFKEDVNLLGADSIKTPISYTPFLAQYSGNWRSEHAMTSFDVGMHFSVRGLGNSQKEFEEKRYLAKANYLYLTGDLKTQHELPWGMEMVGHFSGQAADSPLISNEQFSLGGAQSVRGYFETQALADDAVFGSLELHSPHLGASDWEFVDQLKLLAFFDAGKGWIKNALPGNAKGNFLSSGGVGLRFQMWKKLSGALDIGIPFSSLAPVNSGDPRVHFNIATEF
ncbi:ShlB/FhaC/HecB family hemolysin secretion/activation protein [Methylomonas montana]|uniref:ShlB/FhaC/HecB family hemolysin secretion/activation protein n=1 Tax=Methylomonas montana TaxID=3058963 RepID=UPI00265AE43B|nr:POTRA domain-containing protein [Methylomonas montana]WKJ89050.1 ShlB/FhaC/HecB family hemolysin secretion/activation protein [Methylomonas montana]